MPVDDKPVQPEAAENQPEPALLKKETSSFMREDEEAPAQKEEVKDEPMESDN